MSSPNTRSLRIVVQHTQHSRYRLAAYGGVGRDYISRSAEFESLDHLRQALRSVARDFDESALLVRKGTLETYIAFSGEMELDDSQLSLLGLNDHKES